MLKKTGVLDHYWIMDVKHEPVSTAKCLIFVLPTGDILFLLTLKRLKTRKKNRLFNFDILFVLFGMD